MSAALAHVIQLRGRLDTIRLELNTLATGVSLPINVRWPIGQAVDRLDAADDLLTDAIIDGEAVLSGDDA